MKKTLLYAALLLTIVCAGSCKKSEEDTTKPSLSGLALEGNYSNFMAVGSEVYVRANIDDLIGSDGTTPETVGIYYTSQSGARDTLTTDVRKSNPYYSITLEEAGTYSVICYAFAGDDYYTTSTSLSIVSVDPETAISGLAGEITDIDGTPYYCMEAGGKTWMGNNLYSTLSGSNYQDSEVMASVFGKYYSWEEAQYACPEGWHLPTAQEFDQCLGGRAGALMVNATFIDVTMWSYWPAVSISNATSFNALPVGYMDFTNSTTPEGGYKEYACFWTADEKDGLGIYRYIFEQSDTVQKGQGSKESLAMSVRCVKD